MKRWIGIILACSVMLQTGCVQNENIEKGEIDISMEEGASAAIDINTKEETADTDNSKARIIDEEKIINFEEAFREFSIPANPSRDITTEDYSEDFPQELQEVLIQQNDDIEAGDQDWQDYEADCETITRDTAGDLPFEDIVAATLDLYGPFGVVAKVVDIDSDGENEYFIYGAVGIGKYGKTFVVKNIDGNWTLIGGHFYPYTTELYTVLEYEGRYYLLMGNQLAFWNDEAEMPDWENAPAPGQTDCWNTLTVERKVTGYTPHELYSNSQDMAMDVLSQVDLTDLSQNAEEYDMMCSWETEHNRFYVRYAWTVPDETEEYEYVISEITDGTHYLEDLVLTVTRKTEDGMQEIVKVYYLAANFNMNFIGDPR